MGVFGSDMGDSLSVVRRGFGAVSIYTDDRRSHQSFVRGWGEEQTISGVWKIGRYG